MANWQETFRSWELQLKNGSEESTSECVKEILRMVEAITKSDGRATIACKVLNLVCRVLNVKAGVDLFTLLSKYIFDKFWATFVNSFKYFMAVLISKKMWSEAVAILPVIYKCELNETTYKDLLNVHATCCVTLVIYKQIPENNFALCSKHLIDILSFVRRKYCNEYLDLVYELLGSNKNFQILILKKLEGTESFLNYIANELMKFENLSSTCDFNEKACTMIIFLVNVDVRNKTKFALLFLKASISVAKINPNPNLANILVKLYTLISFLIKILIEKETPKFNTHLIDILDKLSRLLQIEKSEDSWNACGSYVVCNILLRFSGVIREKLDLENIDSIYTLLITLARVLLQREVLTLYFSKTYCLECDNLHAHIMWSLLHLQSIVLRKSMQINAKNTTYGELFIETLNRAIKTYSEPSCSELKANIQNAFRESYSVLKQSIQSKMCISVSLECLNAWRKIQLAREQISDMQTIYLYRHLLKLKESHREALEMHCLYIIHLINSEDSKQNLIFDEIALCCATYTEAKVDYEQSICDILDKVSIDLQVPPYDRKLVKRYQLHVSAKYAGIDTKLKTYLAKIVVEETEDEVELSEVLSVIGKTSFPEIQAKVLSSVKILKRKLLTHKNDCHKHLALARLLLYQHKILLERIKESRNVGSFNEAKLHEMKIDYFKKIDICSENKIQEDLIDAKRHFETFYNTENLDKCTRNWDQIIDDISTLARHFTLRGYLDQSFECWLLIYRIAEKFNLMLSKMRAISFFAEYSEAMCTNDLINIDTTINDVSNDLLSHYEKLDSHSPRQQNYILLAIINIASYYNRKNQATNSLLLVELARKARNILKNRENSTDLISISLLAYDFYTVMSSNRMNMESPYFYVHSIMDAIASVKHITSEDSINLPTFLFRLVVDLAHFGMYRMCSSTIRPFLYSLLHCVAEFSLSFRMAQIVSILANIDLQMERTDMCHTKLIILNTLLNKAPRSTNKTCLQTVKPKIDFLTPNLIDAYDLAIEPARRVPLSPKNIKQPYLSFNNVTASEFLLDHPSKCTCEFCRNPLFKLVSFQLGCLHAQNNYINGDFLSTEIFCEQALRWWKSNLMSSPMLKYYSYDSAFWSLIYYINTLRRLNLFERAQTAIEEARMFLEQYGKAQDQTYAHILVEAEICVADMLKSLVKLDEIISSSNQCDKNFQTPARTIKSRSKPLDIITSIKTKTKATSSASDIEVVSNLISDLKISESKNNKQSPTIEEYHKTRVKKTEIVEGNSKVAKARQISKTSVNSNSSSNKDDNENRPSQKAGINRVTKCSMSTSKNDSKSRKGAQNETKTSEHLEQPRNTRITRIRRNRC